MAVRAQILHEHDVIVDGVVTLVLADVGARHELGWIATELGYSERQLRRILHDRSIIWRPWLAEQRMRRGAELLLSGRYVQQVARKVGYCPAHFAAPFSAYAGILPSEARRVGQLQSQLRALARNPPRSADIAANCRAIDRWARLHHEARGLLRSVTPGTPVAAVLQDAMTCTPPRRPRHAPRGRRRRQIVLAREFRAVMFDGADSPSAGR